MSSVAIWRASVSADRSVENVSTGPVGSWRIGMNVARSAITESTRWPEMKLVRSSQCEPISPTARSAPPRSGCSRQFQSVSRSSQSWKYRPVTRRTSPTSPASDDLVGVLVERVEADVEVDGVDHARSGRQGEELGRVRGGHRERLLADDVPAAGEDRGGLLHVEVVGRGDVDDVHRRVGQEGVERGIRLRRH